MLNYSVVYKEGMCNWLTCFQGGFNTQDQYAEFENEINQIKAHMNEMRERGSIEDVLPGHPEGLEESESRDSSSDSTATDSMF